MNLRPRITAIISALLLLVSAALADAQNLDSSPIAKTLNQLVRGKEVRTKMPIVSDLVARRSFSNAVHYAYVDTGFYEDGTVVYHVLDSKNGTSYFVKLYVIKDTTKVLQPGSMIQVDWKISYLPDRIEIGWHSSSGSDKRGFISVMLSHGHETWPVDRIVNSLNKIITIPAIAEYESLRGELVNAESKYNVPGGTADFRLANAIAIRQVLEKLQKNRAEYIAMGMTDPQAGIFSDKLNALMPQIARLTEEARKDRVEQLRNQLQAQLPEISEVQNQVRQKPPSSLAEWHQRSESLARYTTLLDERQRLFAKLHEDNEAPSPDDMKTLNDSRAEIGTVNQALEQSHRRLQLADLNSQYGQLTKKRAQKLDAYTRAFGTNKERAALQDLNAVLGQIVTNREQAAALGDKTAATQLTQCRAEAAKYRRK